MKHLYYVSQTTAGLQTQKMLGKKFFKMYIKIAQSSLNNMVTKI